MPYRLIAFTCGLKTLVCSLFMEHLTCVSNSVRDYNDRNESHMVVCYTVK